MLTATVSTFYVLMITLFYVQGINVLREGYCGEVPKIERKRTSARHGRSSSPMWMAKQGSEEGKRRRGGRSGLGRWAAWRARWFRKPAVRTARNQVCCDRWYRTSRHPIATGRGLSSSAPILPQTMPQHLLYLAFASSAAAP